MDVMNDIEEEEEAICIALFVVAFLLNTGRALKAIEMCKECLIFLNTKAMRKEKEQVILITTAIKRKIFQAYCLLPDYTNAIKYGKEILGLCCVCGEEVKDGEVTIALADVYQRQCKFAEAREHYEKAINLTKETGDRKRQADAYGKFGVMSYRLGECDKAKKYLEKALAITIEIADKEGEATSSGNLGTLFQSLGEYDKAKEYYEKALVISIEIANRKGQATYYRNLGTVFRYLGEYDKAKEYLEKALAMSIEIGDRKGQAVGYGNLGTVFQFRSDYEKAKEYHEKALAIRIETGDREGQEADNGNLGTVFKSLGEYEKAKEYYEKARVISIENGNREGEAKSYGNLGLVFQSLGEYDKAKEYLEKALAISIETGHREGQAASYGNLGSLFKSLGEYGITKEYYERARVIMIEIGNRAGQASLYANLGTVFRFFGEYDKAKGYYEKALAITIEIGDKKGESANYSNLGTFFRFLGEHDKAKEYHEKALAIGIAIGDREGEATSYENLGTLFHSLGQYVMAEGYLKKALSISQDIGIAVTELSCYCELSMVKLSLEEIQEAFVYLLLSFNKSEHLRGFLRDNDELKISFSDVHNFPYQNLAAFFCVSGNPNNALYVLELARARALTDLMASQYLVEMQISVDPQSWIGIENVMKKESNCTCLYISYYGKDVFLWILKNSGAIHFRRITVNENIAGAKLVSSLDDFFAGSFRNLGILPQLDCEDRSLNSCESETKCPQEEKLADLPLVEDGDNDNHDPKPSLPLLYKIIIAPVADLLEEPEIIIVPDRALYQVPFVALSDRSGKCLSEAFRIRIVPSLSTLKLIQDSPADYHSQTGALIVGDPVVGWVRYKGRVENFKPLPCARKEAEMIGKLLCVHPLLGQHATKQAVLEMLHSVSLIHFAAHGDAEKGEIALSPLRSTEKIPHEDDYLLTMSDISKVQLRAKLVVLSCCHSGCGQIRPEGVIGIARAFLGSGARSVLVTLWAIEDRATEQLMRCFYEHLVRGESASESLHKTMKWMRGNGFTEVCQWASFMLIGDNVTFEFGK